MTSPQNQIFIEMGIAKKALEYLKFSFSLQLDKNVKVDVNTWTKKNSNIKTVKSREYCLSCVFVYFSSRDSYI